MKNVIAFFMFTAVLLASRPAYAADCTNLGSADVKASQILCPVYRLFNAAVLLGGIGLVIFIAIGAIKMGLAFGSPDKLNQATATWSHALIGFFIIVGAVSIYLIITTSLGVDTFGGFAAIKATFDGYIQELLQTFVIKQS